MGLDPEVIASRLARLDEYVRVLEDLAQIDEATFIADPRTHGSAERFLHLGIECIFDIGTHCIAGFRNRLVHDYFRLDRRRVHVFIRTRLDGFRHFARDVARWLDSSPES